MGRDVVPSTGSRRATWWTTPDTQGNAIANNFTSISPQSTMTVPATASGFTARGCNYFWSTSFPTGRVRKRVSPWVSPSTSRMATESLVGRSRPRARKRVLLERPAPQRTALHPDADQGGAAAGKTKRHMLAEDLGLPN